MIRAVLALAGILLTAALFKLAFAPPLSTGPFVLTMSPVIHQSVADALANDWTALLLPYPYEPPRNFWSPSAIFLMYFAQNILGSYGAFIFWSSICVATVFSCALICSRSLIFAATIAFTIAFGTQLDYAYTYGNLVTLYLLLSYIALNATLAVLFVTGRLNGPITLVGFALSLVITALSNEMWLNYASALLAGGIFVVIWAHHHRQISVRTRSLALLGVTCLVLAAYLLVRLQFVSEYVAPGAEEELLITYRSKLLFFDDALTNFFTLLYMSIDNYLPSFISSSNSLSYLGKELILAEQHGYDLPHQNLVIMNHLFLWRFYAGILVTLFCSFSTWAIVKAWRRPEVGAMVISVLCLMVLAGFSTHLSIKMRPYNSVPALPYKVVVSVSFFSVLIGYLVMVAADWFRSRRAYWGLVSTVWACVLVAAVTRPGMQDRLLAEVGLTGLGDPLGQIAQWLR